jgi:hypothetical protein
MSWNAAHVGKQILAQAHNEVGKLLHEKRPRTDFVYGSWASDTIWADSG